MNLRKKSVLLFISCWGLVLCSLLVINSPVQANGNLHQGKKLFFQARTDYYNSPLYDKSPAKKDRVIAQSISQLKESKEYFKQLKTKFNRYYWQGRVHFFLAEIQETKKNKRKAAINFKKTETLAKKALRTNNTSSKAHRLLADSYVRQMNYRGGLYAAKYGPKALRLLKKAVELDKTNYRAWNSLGTYYHFAPKIGGGDTAKAIKALNKALTSKDEYITFLSYVWLGTIYQQKKNNLIKAKSYFQQALAIYPHNHWAQKKLKKVSHKGGN